VTTPVEPQPAASVLLVRPAPPGAPEPLEVWMIRRQKRMKFLGGYYAFPGGRVDAGDAAPGALARCYGAPPAEAEETVPGGARPPLAYSVTAVRELLEESGVLLACHADGRPIDTRDPSVADAVDHLRTTLMAGATPFPELLAGAGWCCDVRGLRHLSHFVTPTASPIRFSARFFLCPLPAGQTPRLYTEETSEAFWIMPGEGYRRFQAGEMPMAEPAEYGLVYLAQFESLEELWAAHADRRPKFHGIIDRIDSFWGDVDWSTRQWRGTPSPRR
jgi:recombination protein RecT